MTTGSERRDDGVIVVPSDGDDVVVVSSEEDEQLVHRPITGHPQDGPDDLGRPVSDRAPDDPADPADPVADSSLGHDDEMLDAETDTGATDTGMTGTGVTGTDLADERRPGEPRAPLSPAGPPAAAARPASSPMPATPVGGDWPAIQSLFVDDPRQAVEQAADAITVALDQLLEVARDHEAALRQQWQGGSADTEQLRTALRGYREFAGRIAGLARDF